MIFLILEFFLKIAIYFLIHIKTYKNHLNQKVLDNLNGIKWIFLMQK